MNKPTPPNNRPRRKREFVPEIVCDALRQILGHVRTVELKAFIENPGNGDLFGSVVVCERWLNRVAPLEAGKEKGP